MNSCWVNTGAFCTCHKFLTGFGKKWSPNQDEVDFFMGNREKVKVERIGTVKLKLESRSCLELFDTVYDPSMRHTFPLPDFINWFTLILSVIVYLS